MRYNRLNHSDKELLISNIMSWILLKTKENEEMYKKACDWIKSGNKPDRYALEVIENTHKWIPMKGDSVYYRTLLRRCLSEENPEVTKRKNGFLRLKY